MSHAETVLAVVVGVYVAGVVLLTLAARWWEGFRRALSSPLGGMDVKHEAGMVILMWPIVTPMVLLILSLSIPLMCITYFLPED